MPPAAPLAPLPDQPPADLLSGPARPVPTAWRDAALAIAIEGARSPFPKPWARGQAWRQALVRDPSLDREDLRRIAEAWPRRIELPSLEEEMERGRPSEPLTDFVAWIGHPGWGPDAVAGPCEQIECHPVLERLLTRTLLRARWERRGPAGAQQAPWGAWAQQPDEVARYAARVLERAGQDSQAPWGPESPIVSLWLAGLLASDQSVAVGARLGARGTDFPDVFHYVLPLMADSPLLDHTPQVGAQVLDLRAPDPHGTALSRSLGPYRRWQICARVLPALSASVLWDTITELWKWVDIGTMEQSDAIRRLLPHLAELPEAEQQALAMQWREWLAHGDRAERLLALEALRVLRVPTERPPAAHRPRAP